MATRPLQVTDLNSLSYLYTKLNNKITEHTESATAEINEALDEVSTALESVNKALSTMESDYLTKTDASATYATKDELNNKILYGTSVPSTLEEGQVFLVYE